MEFLIVGSKPTKIYNFYKKYGLMKLSKNFIKLNLFKQDLFHLRKCGLIYQNKINTSPLIKWIERRFYPKLR